MENKKLNMDLAIVEELKKSHPGIDINTPRWAELGVAAEFRKLDVGDVVLFPIVNYNYNTIRVTPFTSLMNEKVLEGRRWTTKFDEPNKSIAVLRTA